MIFYLIQAKFWINPQFLVALTDVDADDNENCCTIVIALMQKDARLKRFKTGRDSEESIQFRLYKVSFVHGIIKNNSHIYLLL